MSVQLALSLGAPKPSRVIIAPTTRVAQERLSTSERAAMFDDAERHMVAASASIERIGGGR
ncbi:MAG: hypothetical protein ACYCX6_00120 [Vulcanimicrobiaceae bacterium]